MDLIRKWGVEALRRATNIVVSLNQLLSVIVTLGDAWPDEVISSYVWRLERKGRLAGVLLRPLVDRLFFWQPEHCRQAYLNERARAQMAPEMRDARPT